MRRRGNRSIGVGNSAAGRKEYLDECKCITSNPAGVRGRGDEGGVARRDGEAERENEATGERRSFAGRVLESLLTECHAVWVSPGAWERGREQRRTQGVGSELDLLHSSRLSSFSR